MESVASCPCAPVHSLGGRSSREGRSEVNYIPQVQYSSNCREQSDALESETEQSVPDDLNQRQQISQTKKISTLHSRIDQVESTFALKLMSIVYFYLFMITL